MQRKWLGYGGVATFLLIACSGTGGALTFLGMGREDARGWEDQATNIFSSDRATPQRDQAGTPFCVTCGQTFKCTVKYGDKSSTANIQVKCPSTTQSQLCTDTGEVSAPSTSSTNKSDNNSQTPGQDQQGGSGTSGGDSNRSNYNVRILPGGGYGVTYSINGVTYEISCYPTTEAPTVTVGPTGTGTSTVNPPGTATATGTGTTGGPTTDPYGRCTDASQCQGAANSTCAVSTKTCQPPCQQTSDCPAGGGTPLCTGGKCYLTCSTQNPNCPNGMVCLAATLCGHN